MIEFSVDKYRIAVRIHKAPDAYDLWLQHVKYFDIDDTNYDDTPIYIGVAQGRGWYEDIIAFKSDPIDYAGFHPGILLIPETELLFIGAGKILKIYDLKNHVMIFQKELSFGFLGWERSGDYVMMLEETELGVYNLNGKELWFAYVEPPWTFEVENDTIILNVMDELSRRDINNGNIIK